MPKIEIDPKSLIFHFKTVDDPRVWGRCRHSLTEILVISVCAVLSGARAWMEIEEFAIQREAWLKKYLSLAGGIPSHDTIARVFCLIDPAEFEIAFTNWVKETLDQAPKRICIDGKSVAGTEREFNNGKNKALHLVSIYSRDLSLVLGQAVASSSGMGEIDGAIECLDRLDSNIKGALISVDAGITGQRFVSKIREKKADYLMPVKGNQRWSRAEIQSEFQSKRASDKAEETLKAHGRLDKREVEVRSASSFSDRFHDQWKDVKTVIRIHRERKTKDTRFIVHKRDAAGKSYYERNTAKAWKTITRETFYVSNRKLSAKEALDAIREHWSIENELHWTLDVAFAEDAWRGREKVAARNLAQVRKFAFNLVKKFPDKGSTRIKMQRAAWNLDYLEKVIFGVS